MFGKFFRRPVQRALQLRSVRDGSKASHRTVDTSLFQDAFSQLGGCFPVFIRRNGQPDEYRYRPSSQLLPEFSRLLEPSRPSGCHSLLLALSGTVLRLLKLL